MASKWTAEFYEDKHGKIPVQDWMDDLGPQEFAALNAAITHVLEPHGIGLVSTASELEQAAARTKNRK